MRRTASLSLLSPASWTVTQPLTSSIRPNACRTEANPPVPEKKSVKSRTLADLSSADASHCAAHFLNACGLCKLSIGPGCDTFMYRGEVAFCSQECRERQIIEDAKKGRKKRSASSLKKANLLPPLKSSESSVEAESAAAC